MGTLCYTATVSVDGYVNDADGDFQWSGPGEDVFRFHIERMAPISAEVLGRKTYQLMQYWETDQDDWGVDEQEFADRWRRIEHVVASSTLAPGDITSPTGRLVAALDLDALAQLVADADGEIEIFGPTTAAPAIRAGMVTDFRFFIVPKVVGGGTRALPDDVDLDLDLVELRTFENGFTLLHYRAR